MPCRGGESFLRRLFEPLDYRLQATRPALDPEFPEWGESPFFRLRRVTRARLKDVLSHLYVLLPMLDDDEHAAAVGDDEVEKLLAKGEGWLDRHPQRDEIAQRYLKHDGISCARRSIASRPQRARRSPRRPGKAASAPARVVFEFARPLTVVVTTPNAEYNVKFEGLESDQLRHADHRFEWKRAEFRAWYDRVAARFGYAVRITFIGAVDVALGAPS